MTVAFWMMTVAFLVLWIAFMWQLRAFRDLLDAKNLYRDLWQQRVDEGRR